MNSVQPISFHGKMFIIDYSGQNPVTNYFLFDNKFDQKIVDCAKDICSKSDFKTPLDRKTGTVFKEILENIIGETINMPGNYFMTTNNGKSIVFENNNAHTNGKIIRILV